MKTTLKFLLAIVFTLFLNSCNKGNEQEPVVKDNYLTVTSPTDDKIVFDSNEGEITISFKSSAEWNIAAINTRADEWCSIFPNKGEAGEHNVTLKVKPNTSTDERNATIKLNSGNNEELLYVTQKQKDALIINSSSYSLPATGGTIDIDIQSNISYSYQIDGKSESWIHHLSTKALESSTLSFSIDENNELTNREGTIIITGGEYSEKITVYQESAIPSIIVSEQNIAVGAKGETITIEVKGNVSATPRIPNNIDWISEVTTKAWSTNTYYFLISPNDSYDDRTAAIVFVNDENGLSESVTITQMQKNAIVIATNSYSFNNNGGTFNIEVNSNVDYEVNIGSDWVKKVETKALTTQNLLFEVAKNESYDNRETTISFISKDKDITQEVRVYQSQTNAIIISEKEKTISPDGESFEVEIKANISYDVIMPDVDWIRKIETKALASSTLHLCVEANETYDNRDCVIIIRDNNNQIEDRLSIIQLQKDAIVVAKNEYEFTSEGGTLQIEVSHNVEYEIEASVDWIVRADTKGLNTSSHNFIINENSTYDNREGKITFKSGEISQEILIKQSAISYFETTAETEYLFKGEGGELSFDVNSSLPVEITVSETANNWITPISTKAISTTSYSFRISPYDGIDERSGTIGVSSCDTTFVISIRQGDNLQMPNEIWYVSTDGDIVSPLSSIEWGGAKITSNVYNSDKNIGIITFDLPVYTIGNQAFMSCNSLKEIFIPSQVTEIAGSAFKNCLLLEKVTCNTKLEEIKSSAFYGCKQLKQIILHNSISTIGSSCFYNCSSLKGIMLPENLSSIGANAFQNCTSLTTISIPSNITEIPKYAFDGCSALESVTLNDNIRRIDSYAFRAAKSLKSINFPSSLSYIYERAFLDCSSLTEIILPEGFREIYGYYVFSNCTSVTRIVLPSTLRNYGIYAFQGTSGDLEINSDIVATDNYYGAFERWTGKNAKLSDNVNTIGLKAFANSSLTNITFGSGLKTIDDSAFLFSKLTEIDLPDGIEKIGSEVFRGASQLTKISIPNSVTSIGRHCFHNCSSLTSVELPTNDNFTWLQRGLFYGCSSLKNITIPNNINSIGWDKPSYDSYYGNAGLFEGCTSLESITLSENITSLPNYTFAECTTLKTIQLSDNIANIGEYCFKGCTGITTIELPNNTEFTTINCGTFSNCTSLTNIAIPNSVVNIKSKDNSLGTGAFYKCYSLESISIPNSVQSIGQYTFEKCTGLKHIKFSNRMSTIPSGAFDGCTSIEEITIPDYISSIGWGAFEDCTKLHTLTIGINVTGLSSQCFAGCTSLTKVYMKPITPPSLPTGTSKTGVFPNTSFTIYVPEESYDLYTNWCSAWKYEAHHFE